MTRLIPSSIRSESIKKFKELYLQKYQYSLSNQQAEDEAMRLLRLVILLIENYKIDRNKN